MEFTEKGRYIDLNDDLINEILQRVSLDTLERCRLASKTINEYTRSQLFLKSFYGRSDIFVGCMTQYLTQRYRGLARFWHSTLYKKHDSNPALPLDFLPERVKVKVCSSAGGLLFCRSMNAHGPARTNYVCKPTTKQWVAIPSHETSFKTEAYALVVKKVQPLIYSIFRFSRAPNADSKDYTMFCEIFDSNTWLWRRAKDIKFRKSTPLVKMEATTTYTKGAVHFLTCSNQIFAFDIAKEKWRFKSFPRQIKRKPDNDYRHKLSEYRGKLSLYEFTAHNGDSEYVQTWEMENYSLGTWTKGYYLERAGHTFGLSHYDHSRWLYWKISRNSYAEVKADGTNLLYFTQLVPFASDYEPVSLMPPAPPAAAPEEMDHAMVKKKNNKRKRKT